MARSGPRSRTPTPVIFVEHRMLYGKKGTRPEPGHLVPLAKAAIRRPRTHVAAVSCPPTADYPPRTAATRSPGPPRSAAAWAATPSCAKLADSMEGASSIFGKQRS